MLRAHGIPSAHSGTQFTGTQVQTLATCFTCKKSTNTDTCSRPLRAHGIPSAHSGTQFTCLAGKKVKKVQVLTYAHPFGIAAARKVVGVMCPRAVLLALLVQEYTY